MAAYTLRNIPTDLHKAWKIASTVQDLSMRDYCFLAIKRMIDHDLRKKPEAKKGE